MATATAVKSFEESADHRLLEGVMTREVADVEAAIAAGADVNRRNEMGMTPLSMAANTGPLEIVHLLLRHGADASVSDDDDWTPLIYAASTGLTVVVRALVEAAPHVVDVKTKKEGWTAFLRACYRGGAAAAQVLLDAGCDSSVVTKSGQSARSLAAEAGRTDVLEMLDRRSRDSALDSVGDTRVSEQASDV